MEEGIEDHGQKNRPKTRSQKWRQDLIEEVEGEEGDKKDEDKKDMFPFHLLLLPRLPCCQMGFLKHPIQVR